MMTAYFASVLFVVLAEMGDKTQLLAMAFASRYRWQTVMWGVFAATLLNHLFAVLVFHQRLFRKVMCGLQSLQARQPHIVCKAVELQSCSQLLPSLCIRGSLCRFISAPIP